MATQNSIDKKAGELTIDPGASGDSFLQFSINTTGEFRIGVDDTDSDAFVMSQGSALGTNNVLKITSAGESTMPLQPSFVVFQNNDAANVTGDGTLYSMAWDEEILDRGGDFASNTFTAPVTGVYQFVCSIFPTSLSASWTGSYVQLVATGDTYRSHIRNIGVSLFVNSTPLVIEAIIPMTASDTVYAQMMVSGSAKTIDIQGNTGMGGPIGNYFSGMLIC